MLLQISDLSPPISYPHAPPPMDDKKNPLFNQQWQSLTQIASGWLRGGLVRFTEATRIHEREEEDATGMFKPKHKPAGCHIKLTLDCWASSPRVQEVMVKIKKHAHGNSKRLNIRLCGVWWDGLRVAYLLSNTDPLPTEVWPIYWLQNSSLMVTLKDERSMKSEKFITVTFSFINASAVLWKLPLKGVRPCRCLRWGQVTDTYVTCNIYSSFNFSPSAIKVESVPHKFSCLCLNCVYIMYVTDGMTGTPGCLHSMRPARWLPRDRTGITTVPSHRHSRLILIRPDTK